MKKISLIVALAAVTLIGCSQATTNQATTPTSTPTQATQNQADTIPTQTETIVDVAVGNPDFSTLVTALQAADLVETLQGEGPFTVFAPTNDAFAKLPKATLDAVLADKAKLIDILTYHVVPGKVMAADVVKLDSATTVQGQDVMIKVVGSEVMVNDAKVVATDIVTSNGVIHVIDTVIMPN